jgi:hypothetical protein
MQILRKNEDLNLVLNHETDFQTNLGWQENLAQLEDEILGDIINPTENYETVRFIHEPYDSTNNLSENVVEQTDIWFYFYFLNNGTYNNGLDYNRIGITTRENAKMLRQSTESFFRLEFFKTPHILDDNGEIIGYEAPNRINRKLVFAKNLSLPLGEKVFYTGENFNEYIHVPVFMGSNYKNKENMYFFWFQDESVLTETILSGTTTGNTFFMTAKFFNATDGSIVDFTNDAFSVSYSATGITESTDMYYQVDINKTDYSYKVYLFDGEKSTDRYGRTCLPIQFYERGGGSFTKPTYDCTSYVPPPTPAPSQTPAATPAPTPPATPAPTPNVGSGKCYSFTLENSVDRNGYGVSYKPVGGSTVYNKFSELVEDGNGVIYVCSTVDPTQLQYSGPVYNSVGFIQGVTKSGPNANCNSNLDCTPSLPVFVYYRAGEVMDTNLSTTYCNGFGMNGQGYTINSPFYTTDTTLTPGVTKIYSDYNLSSKVVGSWSLSNVTRMAYITESENFNAINTPTTTNPDGDSLYDGGTYKFMRVDSDGTIISLGNSSCGGGGTGGSNEA